MIDVKDWTVEPAKDSAEYLEGPPPRPFERVNLPCGCEVYRESGTPTQRCEKAKKLEAELLREIDDVERTGDWDMAKAVDNELTKHYKADDETIKGIDRRMVKALNCMEEAIKILKELRADAGDKGPKLDKGEAALNQAYAIISAKRPI